MKLKNFIAKLFLFSSTICLTMYLYFYFDTGVTVLAVDYNNSKITVETEEPGERIVKYANNFLFINASKEKISDDKLDIENVNSDKVYLKIYDEIYDVGLHDIKTYKLLNHEHVLVRDDLRSIAPECDKDGLDIFLCSECDNISNETLAALGCDMQFYSYKAPSCSEEGKTTYRCTRCGKVEFTMHPKLEHVFKLSHNLKPSTCIEQGIDLYKCENCEETREEYLDYISHSYVFAGEFNNGSSVGINNKCSYCGKVSTKSFAIQYIGGFQGMINIPSLGVVVPVYCGEPSQSICDAPNSASLQLYSLGVKDIIADHNYQGFSKIRNAVVGKTILYYKGQKYICSENVNGTNNKAGLIYPSGADIKYGPSDLYLYTCNDWGGVSIRIVGWNLA